MNNINQLVVEGNITRVPEFRTTPHGFPVCKIPIAVNYRYKKSGTNDYVGEVSYFDVETFGKLAEICAKYSQKGRGVSVVGRLRQNRWKTEDGKNASRVTIIAEKVEFKTKFRGEAAHSDENMQNTATNETSTITEDEIAENAVNEMSESNVESEEAVF